MHDITDLEGLGLPGVLVASTEFIAAAAIQAAALGAGAARVFVAHPIQDRTDAELRALADHALDDLVGQLVAPMIAAGSR